MVVKRADMRIILAYSAKKKSAKDILVLNIEPRHQFRLPLRQVERNPISFSFKPK